MDRYHLSMQIGQSVHPSNGQIFCPSSIDRSIDTYINLCVCVCVWVCGCVCGCECVCVCVRAHALCVTGGLADKIDARCAGELEGAKGRENHFVLAYFVGNDFPKVSGLVHSLYKGAGQSTFEESKASSGNCERQASETPASMAPICIAFARGQNTPTQRLCKTCS